MSNDEFYADPNQLLNDWLGQIEGGFGLLVEHIDPKYLPLIKNAFLEGYNFGFNAKKMENWQKWNQK